MTNVAFLGLGAIGRPMAHHLAAPGYSLAVWNRTAAKAAAFKAGLAAMTIDGIASTLGVSANSVKIGYPGYIDAQVQAQARRESGLNSGRHHR